MRQVVAAPGELTCGMWIWGEHASLAVVLGVLISAALSLVLGEWNTGPIFMSVRDPRRGGGEIG